MEIEQIIEYLREKRTKVEYEIEEKSRHEHTDYVVQSLFGQAILLNELIGHFVLEKQKILRNQVTI